MRRYLRAVDRRFDGGWCRDFERLAVYNSRRAAGVRHSPKKVAEMVAIQARFDRWQRACTEARAALEGMVVVELDGGGVLTVPPGIEVVELAEGDGL